MNTTLVTTEQASLDAIASGLRAALSPGAVVRISEPMAKHTTLRVGGPADLFIEPANETDLTVVLSFCTKRGVPVFVLGRGSNLLVTDAGIRGAILCLSQPAFSAIDAAGTKLICGAGARLKAVAHEARRHGLAGLEFLEGIPGSVGGALRMNAGAMGSEVFERVESVRMMDFKGDIAELPARELDVAYRCCSTLKTNILLSAIMKGEPGPVPEIERRMKEFSQKRWGAQPAAPSAGCIFKNLITIPAGKLIDELGLKDTRVGAARVSREHGNFIVNDGTATAADMFSLIEIIRVKARRERGLDLELEVQVVGEGAPSFERAGTADLGDRHLKCS